MGSRAFFDTNVLLYLLSPDADKADCAEGLIAGGGMVSVQVLNEFASVALRKFGMTAREIRHSLAAIREVCAVRPVDIATHDAALDLVERRKLSLYDALIVASAIEGGCSVLYSEDLQDGQAFGRLRVRNPFRR